MENEGFSTMAKFFDGLRGKNGFLEISRNKLWNKIFIRPRTVN
jgi:hypothetical protein